MKPMIPAVLCLLLSVVPVMSPAQVAWSIPARSDESPSLLGVYLVDVTAESATALGVKKVEGAVCKEVLPGTPAEEAGLKTNDVITRWDGIRVRSARQFQRLVGDTPVGRRVKVAFFRGGEAQQLKVTVGQRDLLQSQTTTPFPGFDVGQVPFEAWHPPVGGSAQFPGMGEPAPPRLGIAMQVLTDQLGQFFGLPAGATGVLVASVVDGSLAEAAGFKAGDVITEIEGETVADLADVQIRVLQADGVLDLTILRERAELSLQVDLGGAADEAEEDELNQEISYPRGTL